MTIDVERGKVGQVRLNRPEKLNAFTTQMMRDLRDGLLALDADRDCRVIVLSGAGRSFCAGRDLSDVDEFHSDGAIDTVMDGMRIVGEVLDVFSQIRTMTICAVQGHALGLGCALALHCDLTVADPSARLALPQAKRGIAPFASLPSLLRTVPYKVALDMALTGHPIEADRAYALGMVNRLAEPGEAVSLALEIAEAAAETDTAHLSEVKSAVALLDMLPAAEAQGGVLPLATLHHLRNSAS